MWDRLPMDVVNIILCYDGTIIKDRNGKYMNQIAKGDDRYEKLLKIPLKKCLRSGPHVEIYFIKFAHENNKKFMFSMAMTEFHDCIRYVFYKNGDTNSETRFILR